MLFNVCGVCILWVVEGGSLKYRRRQSRQELGSAILNDRHGATSLVDLHLPGTVNGEGCQRQE